MRLQLLCPVAGSGRAESIDLRVTSAIASSSGVVNTALCAGALVSLAVFLAVRAVRKGTGVRCDNIVLIGSVCLLLGPRFCSRTSGSWIPCRPIG